MSQVLHPIEQKILKTLTDKQNLTPEEICEITKLSIDQRSEERRVGKECRL